MRKLIAILALTALASVSFAQAWNTRTVLMKDSILAATGKGGYITADTSLAAIATNQADHCVVTAKLQGLGGSGTYAIIVCTSIDSTIWDSVRVDTLGVTLQKCTWSGSIYSNVHQGSGDGASFAGANGTVPLSNYLKVYVDEIAASSGSGILVKAFLRERKYVR